MSLPIIGPAPTRRRTTFSPTNTMATYKKGSTGGVQKPTIVPNKQITPPQTSAPSSFDTTTYAPWEQPTTSVEKQPWEVTSSSSSLSPVEIQQLKEEIKEEMKQEIKEEIKKEVEEDITQELVDEGIIEPVAIPMDPPIGANSSWSERNSSLSSDVQQILTSEPIKPRTPSPRQTERQMEITDFTLSQPEKELSLPKQMMSSARPTQMEVNVPPSIPQPRQSSIVPAIPELPKPIISSPSSSPTSERRSSSNVQPKPEMMNMGDDGRKILTSTGYTVIGSVSVKHADGKETLFMRALNPIGCIVLVRMDSGSHAVTNPADLSMVESVEATSLDRATMTGIYNSVNPYVKGAAVQCKSGFCVIETSLQDSSEFVQHNYQNQDSVHLGRAYTEEWMTDSNKMIVYPIVSLKDIQSDPVRTLHFTDIACINIQNQATRRGEMDLNHFDHEYQRMSEVCKGTIGQYKTLRASILADLEIRRTNARRAVSMDRSRMDVRSRELLEREYNSNMNAMRREEELLVEMNKIARTIGDLSIDFQAVSEKMVALSKVMSTIIV